MDDARVIEVNSAFDDESVYALAEADIRRLFPNRSVTKVLLISPPDLDQSLFDFSTAHRGRYWNYPPYGFGVIASHLRNEGIAVEILNLNNLMLSRARATDGVDLFDYVKILQLAIADAIEELEPDLVGVTCMFSQTHQSMLDVCDYVKTLRETLPIAVGGVHVTSTYADEQTRKTLLLDLQKIDLLFCYEADLSFLDFLRVVNGWEELDRLCQIVFIGSEPKICFSHRRTPEPNDLNIVPAHDLMLSSELSQNGKIGGFYSFLKPDARMTTLLSNRGCRAQCTFCSVRNFNGVGVRRRSVQSVIDELLELKNEHGVEHVMWLDDDFLYDARESLHLFNEMIKHDVGLTWDCTNGVIAASCTEEVIRAAAESGCIGLNVGMESGNSGILKYIRKPGTIKNFLAAAEVLRNVERINARVFLMIGFPGETYNQIKDTIDLSWEMGLDWYNVTILQPLPNTPIFDEMVADGLIGGINFIDMRYNSGSAGKHRKQAEKTRDPLAADFKSAFEDVDMNTVPDQAELDNIWAYMNFHLNFKRLFLENRPAKLVQQFRYVDNIARLVAPNNAFATYFTGYLGYRTRGNVDPEIIRQLESIIDVSPYWRQRCQEFQLLPDDLKTVNFDHHRRDLTPTGELLGGRS